MVELGHPRNRPEWLVSAATPAGPQAERWIPGTAAGVPVSARDNAGLAEAADGARRRFELLARAGEALSGSLDPDETLRTIGQAIVPAIADWCRIDLLDESGEPQRRLAYHVDSERAAQALAMARKVRALTETPGSMSWVMQTGQSHYGRFDEPKAQADEALRTFTGAFGMHAHYIIPLVARGRTIGAMGVIQAESGRDLTPDDRALILELGRRAALALDNARLYSAADAANRAKDEFLAMLGHELRNPLAPIATALELMSMRHPHVHVEERRIIGRQVAHMSRLIDDLLDVSRITRGKVQLVREPVDMKAVVASAIELTRPAFEKRSSSLQLDIGSAPAVVIGDRVRLAQVLCNLLTNATKFTPPEGRVTLSLHRAGEWVAVTVEDTGSGIEPELLPRIFDLFVQGQQAIDRSSGGLGLGLAIVRTLVEMHGGDVSASSAGRGKGARFTVRLPLSDAKPMPASAHTSERAPAPAATSRDAPGGRRVLVVDDNVDAAETMAELLHMSGYEVRVAHDAAAALEAHDAFHPDAALLDIGLPQVDGYELARMLRAKARDGKLRLVALTGYGRDNDKARAAQAGFDEHLVKPVAVDALLGVLQRLLSSPASP
jgi:signal transduction histidine kinase/CheY-like chemotaxis protein